MKFFRNPDLLRWIVAGVFLGLVVAFGTLSTGCNGPTYEERVELSDRDDEFARQELFYEYVNSAERPYTQEDFLRSKQAANYRSFCQQVGISPEPGLEAVWEWVELVDPAGK